MSKIFSFTYYILHISVANADISNKFILGQKLEEKSLLVLRLLL